MFWYCEINEGFSCTTMFIKGYVELRQCFVVMLYYGYFIQCILLHYESDYNVLQGLGLVIFRNVFVFLWHLWISMFTNGIHWVLRWIIRLLTCRVSLCLSSFLNFLWLQDSFKCFVRDGFSYIWTAFVLFWYMWRVMLSCDVHLGLG